MLVHQRVPNFNFRGFFTMNFLSLFPSAKFLAHFDRLGEYSYMSISRQQHAAHLRTSIHWIHFSTAILVQACSWWFHGDLSIWVSTIICAILSSGKYCFPFPAYWFWKEDVYIQLYTYIHVSNATRSHPLGAPQSEYQRRFLRHLPLTWPLSLKNYIELLCCILSIRHTICNSYNSFATGWQLAVSIAKSEA